MPRPQQALELKRAESSRGNVRCPCVEARARWSSAMVISTGFTMLMPRRSDAGARHQPPGFFWRILMAFDFFSMANSPVPSIYFLPLSPVLVPDTIPLCMLYARVLLTTTYLFVQACTKPFPCTSAFVAARSQAVHHQRIRPRKFRPAEIYFW